MAPRQLRKIVVNGEIVFRELTVADIDFAKTLYNQGRSIREVETATGIGRGLLHKLLQSGGLVRPADRETFSPAIKRRVVELKKLKMKPRFIAKELGLNPVQVMNIARRNRDAR